MSTSSGRTSKSVAFTPILIVILGIIFLLNNFGILPWELWSNLWKFWPILLILFGVETLVGRQSSFRGLGFLLFLIFLVPVFLILNPFTGNPLATKSLDLDEPLANLTRGRLNFQFQSANIKLADLDHNSTSLFKGTVKYSDLLPKPTLSIDKRLGEGNYTITQPEQKALPFLSSLGNNIVLGLSPLIPLEIKIKSTSGVININLTKIKVDVIQIDTSTSQTNIKFAADFSSKVYIKASAGIVNLTIPKNVSASIKTTSSLKSIKIDEKLFPKNGEIYKSPTFESSQFRVEVEITSQATNVNVN